MRNNNRILSMDFMRIISILMIMCFHLYVEASKNPGVHITDLFKPLGIIGVSFFIIISGGALSTSSKNEFSVLKFYKKRFLSIYPAFWVTYISVALCFFIFGHVVKVGSNPAILAMSFFGMDGYLYSMYKNYYLIGEWFLGFIVIIYTLFPLIRIIYLRSQTSALLISIIISSISFHFNDWIYSHSPFWNANAMWNPTTRLPEFIFGMMFFDFIRDSRRNTLISLYISIFVITISNAFGVGYFENLYSTPLLCASFVATASIYELLKKPSFFIKTIGCLSTYSFIAFLVHHRFIFYIMSNDEIKNITNLRFYLLLSVVIVLSFLSAGILLPVSNKIKGYLS
ncbi:acyltransferase [Rahnella sp. SAP-1]|uniref:Acyltransferase n=1 Tax=Rouxiella aceris TaxID=2703884 RepID=A0A848MI72_9GAMM|nr:acyltransferase [Rouxiella aceris]NMP26831.1 acyltransferase [Rouxiella aceris]